MIINLSFIKEPTLEVAILILIKIVHSFKIDVKSQNYFILVCNLLLQKQKEITEMIYKKDACGSNNIFFNRPRLQIANKF